jgi:carbonic anhydrase
MESHDGCCHMSRRTLIGLSGAALASLAAVGVVGLGSTACADSLTKERRDAMSPDDVIAAMLAGNERFVSGQQKPRDFLAEQRATASGQFPAAVALSCVDSRAPVEVVCDLGIGDTFNARVAGNVVNEDILGSMEFACAVSGAKLVAVMGHTACGAIKGAIDDVKLGNLTGLLAKIHPAVRDTTYDGERTGNNYEFVDAVARTNVAMAVKQIRERSPVLRELEEKGAIKIIGSMYDISTGRVALLT